MGRIWGKRGLRSRLLRDGSHLTAKLSQEPTLSALNR